MKKAPALRFFGSAGAVSETNLRACAAKSAEKTCEKRCETGSQSKTSGNSFVTKDGTAVRIVMPLRSERQVSGYGSNVI